MNFELAFYSIDHRLMALAMVALLAVAGEVGFRGGSRKRDAPEPFRSLMTGIGAAMLGLLGLLLGFTLSMAIARWDARREVLVDESNAIGTLNLRAGLFEEPICDELRTSLREYTDARIALGVSGMVLTQGALHERKVRRYIPGSGPRFSGPGRVKRTPPSCRR